jgi:hypothetical protein
MSLFEVHETVPVFVGSTFIDLKDYRRAVREALGNFNTTLRGMEYFGSRPGKPVDECLAEVRESRVYIGIFGMRYGSIPDGHDRSMTHLEYETAQQQRMPSLIYILNEQVQPILPTHVETGSGAAALLKLKGELRAKHLVSEFTTPDDLARQVSRDLAALIVREESIRDSLPRPSTAALQAATPRTIAPAPVTAHVPLVTFPDELKHFISSVAPGTWSELDVARRRFITTLGTKLEPIVQIVPPTPTPLVIGFEALAIGSLGESFGQVCTMLSDVDPGLVRLQLMLTAMKTVNMLKASATRLGNNGAKHLTFTMNLDPETLDSPFFDELLDRYGDLWEQCVVFEINERVTSAYVSRLKDLQVDFNLRYCADDVNQWNASAKAALMSRVEMSKVDATAFQEAMRRRGEEPAEVIRALASHRVPSKPLVVEGVSEQNHLRFLVRHWPIDKLGPLYGQGYGVKPGAPWEDWMLDLRDVGLPGGHVFRADDNSHDEYTAGVRARRRGQWR